MMHCTPLGDHSLLIDFSESKNPLKEIHGLSKLLFTNKPVWAAEIVPGLSTLVIQLNYRDQTPKQVREQANCSSMRSLSRGDHQTSQEKYLYGRYSGIYAWVCLLWRPQPEVKFASPYIAKTVGAQGERRHSGIANGHLPAVDPWRLESHWSISKRII